MTFNQRILKLIDLEKITRSQFEKSIGVSENYVYKMKNPTLDLIENILKAFPCINRDWLLFDEGEPYHKQYGTPGLTNEPATGYTPEPLTELKAELMSKDIIIRSLVEKVKALEDEAESLRQQKNNYRRTPTKRQQETMHNKGSTSTADKRFSPK